MITADSFIFWFLALVTVASALTVVLVTNPIFSALALAMTMIGISALFVTLNAYFIAGVQLIVYAGAVMVLFVMVLMLFDLKAEIKSFTKGLRTGAVKIAGAALMGGLLVGGIANTVLTERQMSPEELAKKVDSTKEIGQILFTKYLFGFEALGLLLLVVAVGAVALARSRGGTHARD